MSLSDALEQAKAFEAQTVKLYKRVETLDTFAHVVKVHDYLPATLADIRSWLLEHGADEIRDPKGKHTPPGRVLIIWELEESL